MYVRVALYFLDIILDIALIQRLPKLEKLTVLGTAVNRVMEKKKYLWSETSTIFIMSVLRWTLTVSWSWHGLLNGLEKEANCK